MKAFRVLVLAWLLSGVGAVGGSIIGRAFGVRGLPVGAVIGGLAATAGAAALATRLGWLPVVAKALATIGGLVGFALAAWIAVTHLNTPIVPFFSAALSGIGVLVGAGVSTGLRSTRS